MRITIISFTIFLLATTNVFAQNSVFRKYRTECAQFLGIELKKLKDFKVVNEMTFFKMSDSNSIGTAYRMALESKK